MLITRYLRYLTFDASDVGTDLATFNKLYFDMNICWILNIQLRNDRLTTRFELNITKIFFLMYVNMSNSNVNGFSE